MRYKGESNKQGLRKHIPEDWIDFVDCGFLGLRLMVWRYPKGRTFITKLDFKN